MNPHTSLASRIKAGGASVRSLVLALLLGASAHATAARYYIRPSGSDASSGTSQAQAWQSIARLNAANLAPGDTVLFEGGQTFQGTIMLTASDGNSAQNRVVISSFGPSRAIIDGGSGNAINLFNTQGFEIGNLVLKGSGMQTNTADGIVLYTDLLGSLRPKNIALRNLEIFGFGKSGISIGAWNGNAGFGDVLIENVTVHDVLKNGIVTYGYSSSTHVGWSHTNVTIRNCEVKNIPGFADPTHHQGNGIILGQVDGGLIEHCSAHNNGTANIACGGPGGIWAYDSNSLTIQYCESYQNSAGTGCDGIGFDFDGGMTNSVIQYCYSHDNDGSGFLLGQYANAREWKHNVVRFNVSVNDGRTNSGGISLFKGQNTVMHGADIYHNTVYFSKPVANVGAGAFTMVQWYTGIDSVRVMNNVLQTSGTVPISWIPAGYTALMAGNAYWSDTGDFLIYDGNSQYTSLAAWRAATGREYFNGSNTGIAADPLLSNAGLDPSAWPSPPASIAAYQPGQASPVVNAAITLTAFGVAPPSTDFFASTFPSGPAADIGASEFYYGVVSPTVTAPITLQTGTAVTTATPQIASVLPVVTGISTGEQNELNMFPNPLNHGNALHISGAAADTRVEILSISGEHVIDFSGPLLESTEMLTPGIYVVRIYDTRGGLSARKLMVE